MSADRPAPGSEPGPDDARAGGADAEQAEREAAEARARADRNRVRGWIIASAMGLWLIGLGLWQLLTGN
ncbi:hypothetical protein [Agromyces mangrovi Wang et al. 2018]|uniref:hypothetical protein n=1 Tax=Agromyces mangrovi TaxID=1858653 RepID=UPI002572ED4D|nr:hypothetical protein [Agromyces mangrovi]